MLAAVKMIIDQSKSKPSDAQDPLQYPEEKQLPRTPGPSAEQPPAWSAEAASSSSMAFPEPDSTLPAYTDATVATARPDIVSPYAVLTGTQQASQPTGSTFYRQAPQQQYPSFEPTFLIATGQYLTRGFPAVPPPSRTRPHPFASHDVTESDWLRFLQEVKAAGELTEKQNDMARLPIVSIIPVVGSMTTHLIRQQMKKGKSKAVASVVDLWNHHFFHPRHMEIVLMCGMAKLSGLDKHPLSRNESILGWSGDSFIGLVTIELDNEKGRGDTNTYRLFVMPLYSH